MQHKFLSLLAAMTLTASVLPASGAVTSVLAEDEPVKVTGVSDVKWQGNYGEGVGTYPTRAINQITLEFNKPVSGDLAKEDFTVTDTERSDTMEVVGVSVSGNKVVLDTYANSTAGVLADLGGLDYRRNNYSMEVTSSKDIVSEDGSVAAKAGDVFTLTQDNVTNIASDNFEPLILTSEKTGNNIYVQYALPENYSADKAYPMLIHYTGGGQQYREAADDIAKGRNLNTDIYGTDNFGVELDIDFTPKTFTVNAPEDTIVVSVQSIANKAKQPEGYDASADANQVVHYFEDNFAVDDDRVYALGNSQGGVILSKAIYEEPELYAGYMPCNTSIYMGAKKASEDNPDDPIYQATLEYVKSFVSNNVGVYFNAGHNDPTGSWLDDQLPYTLFRKEYAANGYSEDEINELVKFKTYEDADFNAVGSYYYHGATGLACMNQDAISWLYRQRRGAADSIVSVVDTKDETLPTVYAYDKSMTMDEYTENVYTSPIFLVYPDHALTEGGASNLLRELGLADKVDEIAAKAYVINPIGDAYDDDDDAAFLSLLDQFTAMGMNTKLIGIGNGATFVNQKAAQKDWSIAGILTVGGEAGEAPKYPVPVYVSDSDEAVAEAYKKTNDTANDDFSNTFVGKDETLAQAFTNAWDKVFDANGRVGNITGTWYTMKPSQERPYEYYSYLDSAKLGLTRNVVTDQDFDGDGINNLWYEYIPESVKNAEAGTVPMVLMLHGNTNDPRTQATTSGWPKIAAREGIILVEPEWQGSTIAGKQWDAYTEDDSTSEDNDLIDLVELLKKKYPQIDPERIYVEGLSRGAVNSIDLGITHSDVFAAVGAHSAGTMENFYDGLMQKVEADAETIDTPLYFVAGNRDQFLPLTAKGEKGSVFMAVQIYEKLNGIDVTSFDELTNSDPYFGMKFDSYGEITNAGSQKMYGGLMTGTTGQDISLNAIADWGHWNYEPVAEEMWKFFRQHTLNENAPAKDYTIIGGNGSTWKKGTKDAFLEVDAPKDKFTGVLVDDKAVPKDGYTVSGNTVITFIEKYLNSLSVGKHDVEITFTDGSAKGGFAIADADKKPTEPKNNGTTKNNTSKSETPKTGVTFHAGLFGSLAAAGTAVAVCAWFALKKRK